MTYIRYKKRKNRYAPRQRPNVQGEVENLRGSIQNRSAAQGEERFSKVLYKRRLEFEYENIPTIEPRHTPGYLTLDFLVKTNFGYRAFEIDDMEFIHHGQREKAEAMLKDFRRLEGLNAKGYNVLKIEHIDAARLKTQDDTEKVGKELFG